MPLVTLLENSEVFRLVYDEEADLEDLRQQVRDGDLAGLIIIPDGYSQKLMDGEAAALSLVADAEAISTTTIKSALSADTGRFYTAVLAAELSVQAYQEQEAFSDEAAKQAYFMAALDEAIAAWENPPFKTKNTQTGAPGPEEDDGEITMNDNAFVQASPAMIAQFTIAGLLGAANILVEEKKSRSLQRLLTTPISKAQILLGHFLAMFVMIFLQVALLVGFGQFFLRLDYFTHWDATLLMVVTVALSAAALGLLIAAISKNQENVTVYSLLPMFIFSGLGGAWVPLEFTSEFVQTVGHFTPVAWAMDGFQNILSRGLGLENILLPAGALLGFTALWFVLAVWLFRYE